MKVIALVVVAVLATGCGAHHGQATKPPPTSPPAEVASSGVLTGRLVGTGGPYGAPNTPYHGEIRAVRSDGRTWTARTDRHGRFRLQLSSGDYVVTGRTPEYDVGASWPCRATHGVTVLPSGPSHENVWCVRG